MAKYADAERPIAALLTLPNGISLVRLGCVPLLGWLLLGGEPMHAALLLGLLGATDWVDGYLARRLGQVSMVGKVLDPAADRALLGVALIGSLLTGYVPMWLGELMLARESLVSAGTVTLAFVRAPRVDVVWEGKAGTFALMVALPLFLVAHSAVSWSRTAGSLAWVATAVGLTMGWAAVAAYIPRALRSLGQAQIWRGR